MVEKALNFKFGQLNTLSTPNIGRSYDPETTSGIDSIKQNTADSFKSNSMAHRGTYRGVCLNEPVVVSVPAASWVSSVYGEKEEPEPRLAVIAYIPELHGATLPNPFEQPIIDGKLDQKTVTMYPTFYAIDEDVETPKPGDIVNLDFSDKVNLVGGIYIGRTYDSPVGIDDVAKSKEAFKDAKKKQALQKGTAARAAAAKKDAPVGLGNKPDIPYDKIPYKEKLESLDPRLATKVVEILEAMESRGFRPVLYAAHRTLYEQEVLYRAGHSKVKFSFHNAYKNGKKNAYAADILDKAFMGEYGGRWAKLKSPKRKPFWDALGEEARKRGLVWGGDWSFFDPAHVQLLPNRKLAQARRETGTGMA